jgi:hypothetical protein
MCAPIWGYTFAWSNGLTGLLQGTPFFLGAVRPAAM